LQSVKKDPLAFQQFLDSLHWNEQSVPMALQSDESITSVEPGGFLIFRVDHNGERGNVFAVLESSLQSSHQQDLAESSTTKLLAASQPSQKRREQLVVLRNAQSSRKLLR
jgi:hypothetical protein